MAFSIDKHIIQKLQTLYLWIYDWTGLYVASIAAIAAIAGSAVVGFTPMQAFFCILNLVILIPYYLDQDKARYTAFNARAIMSQESIIRFGISWMFVGMSVGEIATGFYVGAFNTVMLWLYINITTVCIREREPKEWFKKTKLATETSL